jgi:hypothetical protein
VLAPGIFSGMSKHFRGHGPKHSSLFYHTVSAKEKTITNIDNTVPLSKLVMKNKLECLSVASFWGNPLFESEARAYHV